MEEVAFQEYRGHYLNIALTLSRVCGLAIANARRREELQAVNRELEGYAHTVSHDLKGPLSGVVSGAELLLGLLEDPSRPDRADSPGGCRQDHAGQRREIHRPG